ncbi:Chlorophyll a-b binding protein CP29 [Tetrabaena socialis]|uniref:Chlorophyll a-b binding protein, chloroplastic n=1 Tax=Tetrabaena socialis TaxID=47790 RepID=A0A2J7ZYN0_9CHLO|nr:Chlorophyll a-b binding protein CP29 [Tetrabaena socialis]|eukprot:PNH05356.1 Chlorophyll a-b binding protein CP29 [Tetrabaena socialis]
MSSFLGSKPFGVASKAKWTMDKKFSLPSFGAKAGTVKKAGTTTTKPAAKSTTKKVVGSSGTRSGGVGYRKYQGDALWLPNTVRPEWLDGSLPGDRGFDPLGLSKPSEFVVIGVDDNDQNVAQNKKGTVEAVVQASPDEVSSENRLSPYSEVFGLARFRECEVVHGRWAMLACLGCLVAEATTGVSWCVLGATDLLIGVEAGKVELDGASYAGLSLPFSITQLIWIEVLLVGGAEVYRNTETNPEKRCYPGGFFDPLKLASEDEERAFRLKTAEIKHARLAMVAFLGYSVQALSTGEGALGSLAKFADGLNSGKAL